MSLNRCRNIYTLGNMGAKTLLKRRQQLSDPFEKDPFKVQSYNFRYADRPSYPVVALQAKTNESNKANGCQTFFYNYNFPNTHVNLKRSSALQNDQSGLNLTSFQEYRRKKFLQESLPMRLRDSTKTIPTQPGANKILSMYNAAQPNSKCSPNLLMKPNYIQTSKPSYTLSNYENLNTSKVTQATSSLTPQAPTRISDVNVQSKRGLSSGCEININIKSLEDNSLQDNVNIKIETDSICRNLNLNSQTKQNSFVYKNNKLERYHSSETFVMDKMTLPNYTLRVKCQDSQQIAKKKDTERINELTSIYSSKVLKKSTTKRNNTSNERLPSFITTAGYTTTRFDDYNFMKNNLTRSKSVLEKTKSKDNKSITHNSLKNSPYNNNFNAPIKRLYSVNQTSAYGSRHSLPATFKRSDLKMSSNAKLPINVNINVYADKLKLLNI